VFFSVYSLDEFDSLVIFSGFGAKSGLYNCKIKPKTPIFRSKQPLLGQETVGKEEFGRNCQTLFPAQKLWKSVKLG